MPCSCGNTSCPCGIPCYCLEESCKCPECAIALHPFCKICDKPLIADIQKDEGTCSCFMVEPASLILENRCNQQYQMDNIPMPVGNFANGRLIASTRTPVLPFPQFLPQQPFILRPYPPSMQADIRNILPSFISGIGAVTPSSGDSDILSTAELYQLEKSNKEPTYTDICSTDISCKETFSPFFFQSTDEKKIANVMRSIKSETEKSAIAQKQSGRGNISRPIRLAGPVWRLPNTAFCIADDPDSNPNLGNPFHVAGPVHTTQAMSTLEKKCCQQASNFNVDSYSHVQKERLTFLKRNDEPSCSTKIGKPDFEVHGERKEFEASYAFAAENEFSALTLTGDFKETSLIEPSNEISEKYITHDKKLTAFSSEISCSGEHLSSVQRQAACAASTFSSANNDCLQNCSVGHDVTKTVSSSEERFCRCLEVSGKQISLEYFLSEPEGLSTQSDNPNPDFANNQRDEKIDSIPLYIDDSTTQKMEKLLKPSKH